MPHLPSTVKNPLTIIAVFAGLTETVGVGILPFLEDQNQRFFLWFLVTYPFFLLVLFFATLWIKPQVLYAPSDFKDERNFMDLFTPASLEETLKKEEKELVFLENEKSVEVEDKTSDISKEPFALSNSQSDQSTGDGKHESNYEDAGKERRKTGSWFKDEAIRLIANEYPKEKIFRNLKLNTDKPFSGFVFDAVIGPETPSPVMVEVREIYVEDSKLINEIVNILSGIGMALLHVPNLAKNSSILLALVFELDQLPRIDEIEKSVRTELESHYPIEFDIRLYQKHELEKSWMLNWALNGIEN